MLENKIQCYTASFQYCLPTPFTTPKIKAQRVKNDCFSLAQFLATVYPIVHIRVVSYKKVMDKDKPLICVQCGSCKDTLLCTVCSVIIIIINPLNHKGPWGTTDDFAIICTHCVILQRCSALQDLHNACR